ncbi:MAG: cyclic nucleotide-binding domain-containing protein [Alphaproteobacteria bacterium]|nr:cyclic nucleotide-binding domain-containing protein [Alphaproteobacteria bacterium]CAA6603333.1 cAMP-binding protein [Rhodospirillaceae bacterium LM-1]
MTSKFVERKVFYPGQKIFGEGEEGNRAFLVEKGIVEIIKRNEEGEERVLGTIVQGGIFGEMALIDNQPRMASARAAAETSVSIIPRQAFEDKLKHADPFLRALLTIFVRNIRALTTEKMKRDK